MFLENGYILSMISWRNATTIRKLFLKKTQNFFRSNYVLRKVFLWSVKTSAYSTWADFSDKTTMSSWRKTGFYVLLKNAHLVLWNDYVLLVVPICSGNSIYRFRDIKLLRFAFQYLIISIPIISIISIYPSEVCL